MTSPAAHWRARTVVLILVGILPTFANHADAAPEGSAQSSTVIGSNVLLVAGTQALIDSDWPRGVQLTELALASPLSRDDRAAALANLCAGHAGLKHFAKAIDYCNQSLKLNDSNWRAWQNRAACNLGLGKIEESLKDLQRGLELNPDAESLQQSLVIVRQYEKLQQERLQQLLES